MRGSVKVVDSWAMAAWVRGEPSAPLVQRFILDADTGDLQLVMSWVNAAETFYILAKRDSPDLAEVFLTRFRSLPIRMVLPDEGGIMAAARIKAAHATLSEIPLQSHWRRRRMAVSLRATGRFGGGGCRSIGWGCRPGGLSPRG
jgi:hypothetical protein